MSKPRSKVLWSACVVISAFSIPTIAAADDLDVRFAKISIGETRDGVIALMGRRPNTEVNADTLGIAHEKLIWNSMNHVLIVLTVMDRVVGTKTCSPNASC